MKWKTIAIIFIILFTVETLYVITVWNLAMEVNNKEQYCGYNICQDYEVYSFDPYQNICYCYIDDVIIHQTYIDTT